jgi:hypothetical protein
MQQLLETPVQGMSRDWDQLLAGTRSGDIELSVLLQERLKPGIRVLLSRRVLCDSEEAVMAQVLASVVDAIRAGEVHNRVDLARATRLSIATHVAPKHSAARENWTANPAAALNNHLSARERDMMRRFYVLAEDPNEICRAMGVTMEEFTRVKSLARAAVAVSLAASRRARPVLVSNRSVPA